MKSLNSKRVFFLLFYVSLYNLLFGNLHTQFGVLLEAYEMLHVFLFLCTYRHELNFTAADFWILELKLITGKRKGIFQIMTVINLRRLFSFTIILTQSSQKQRNKKDLIIILTQFLFSCLLCWNIHTQQQERKSGYIN